MNTPYTYGDAVWIRDAAGKWHPTFAASGIFFNTEDVLYRQTPYEVVRVWVSSNEVVNWPAEDVRPRPDGEEPPE